MPKLKSRVSCPVFVRNYDSFRLCNRSAHEQVCWLHSCSKQGSLEPRDTPVWLLQCSTTCGAKKGDKLEQMQNRSDKGELPEIHDKVKITSWRNSRAGSHSVDF